MNYFSLLPAAENDLEAIWIYSAKTWGVEQANAYVDELVDTFQLLADNPLMCRERNEFSPPVHIHHHAHHLIVFVHAPNGISIVRVLHESMDIDSQL